MILSQAVLRQRRQQDECHLLVLNGRHFLWTPAEVSITWMSWAILLLNNTYTAQDDTSMRGVASRVSPSFRQVLEGWKKPSVLLGVWPGHMLRRTLTLLLVG